MATRKKRMKVLTLSERRKRREFEGREVYKKKGLSKNLTPTGYEAYRVSPQTTTKFGKKYRKIYGATVQPDYQRPQTYNKFGKGKRFGAKVNWYHHAYAPASTKSGTRTLTNLKGYPVNVKEARRKLMMKKRKK